MAGEITMTVIDQQLANTLKVSEDNIESTVSIRIAESDSSSMISDRRHEGETNKSEVTAAIIDQKLICSTINGDDSIEFPISIQITQCYVPAGTGQSGDIRRRCIPAASIIDQNLARVSVIKDEDIKILVAIEIAKGDLIPEIIPSWKVGRGKNAASLIRSATDLAHH